MKICIFTDIHGNLDALKLLMQTDDFNSADLKICLGDAVFIGPYPNECCKLLLDNNCIWIMGNHDSYIANGLPEEEYKYFSKDKINQINHVQNILNEQYKKIMKNLPKEHYISIENKKLYFTHYMWETWNNVIDIPETSTIEKISNIYSNVDADYIFYGHEHKFYNLSDNKKDFICVGSLGANYPGDYVTLEIENNNIKINHKTINYNLEKFKNDIKIFNS